MCLHAKYSFLSFLDLHFHIMYSINVCANLIQPTKMVQNMYKNGHIKEFSTAQSDSS